MTRIDELLELAVVDAPPSRLEADRVLRAARGRRVRRIVATTLSAVTVVAAAGVGAISLYGTGGQTTGHGMPLHGYWWGTQVDADHLYATRNVCEAPDGRGLRPPEGSPDGCVELLASTDGGRTWQSRGVMPPGPIDVEVYGPLALVRNVAKKPLAWEFTIDGGVTWASLPPMGPAIEAVPAGLLAGQDMDTNVLTALDPASGKIRPLANQPNVAYPNLQATPLNTGLWVGGIDPDNRRPMVAVSHDGGLTWTTAELPGADPAPNSFPGMPGSSVGDHLLYDVVTRDGQLAYATYRTGEEQSVRVYRTDDGGVTWQFLGYHPGYSFLWVTLIGTLVVATHGEWPEGAAGPQPMKFDQWAATPARFISAPVTGLPPTTTTVNGQLAVGDFTLFRSDDGFAWRPILRP